MLTMGISSVENTSHTPSLAITTSDQSSWIVISKTCSQSGRITPGVPPSSASFRGHRVVVFAVGRQGRERGRGGCTKAVQPSQNILRRILVYNNIKIKPRSNNHYHCCQQQQQQRQQQQLPKNLSRGVLKGFVLHLIAYQTFVPDTCLRQQGRLATPTRVQRAIVYWKVCVCILL